MWWPNISWTFFDVSCIKMQFCVMNNTCWTHFHAYSQKTGIQKDADAPFVPTVTAVASAPDLKWMVLSTDISSVSPCRQEKTQSSSHSTDAKPARKTFTSRRKGVKDQVNTYIYIFKTVTSKLSIYIWFVFKCNRAFWRIPHSACFSMYLRLIYIGKDSDLPCFHFFFKLRFFIGIYNSMKNL